MRIIDLDELERFAEQATPGPWQMQDSPRAPWIAGDYDDPNGAWPIADMEITGARTQYEKADAAFIAASDPQTVAALVRAVRAAIAAKHAINGDVPNSASPAFYALDDALAPFKGAA